ncbi:MAG: 23S rRNA pseudouridine(1911/1915/1917) synthase RluD [Gammaproteobacteria bacterium]|nr:MAG: 23S rRNA pseudouridine(1911/1915/1917) synthase RluD [Gammaproteobacteria bacterium]
MTDNLVTEFIVPARLGEQRLDRVLAELLDGYSRSQIQSWIKAGDITLNGRPVKPREKVREGDRLELDVTLPEQGDWVAEAIELDVLFEDDHLLVINKPAGLVVHPAPGHQTGTLVNAVLAHHSEARTLPRAGIVHRLDKDTSGVMVVAKSLIAHASLVAQLQSRDMGREYVAVVQGEMTGGGEVDAPIGRDPRHRTRMAVVPDGKPAVTHYRIAERFAGFTQVDCQLESGRTHQIRVHLSHIGYPLIGDPVYGGRARLPKGASAELLETLHQFRRQALHARWLHLVHPQTGEALEFEAPLPEDLEVLLQALRAHTVARQ